MTFPQWFASQQGIPYDSSWLFAKAAWDHQQVVIEALQAENAKLLARCNDCHERGDL